MNPRDDAAAHAVRAEALHVERDAMPLDRSVEAALAELGARMGAMEARQREQGGDVREARDLAKSIDAVIRQQNVGEQIEQLRSAIGTAAKEMRSDLVNASTQLERKLSERIAENLAQIAVLDAKVDTNEVHAADRDEKIEDESMKRDEALAKRLKALEDLRERASGAGALMGWLAKYAPVLAAAILGALAALGIKTSIH